MHEIQRKILTFGREGKLVNLSLREMGKTLGIGENPAKVKHHILQLVKKGMVKYSSKTVTVIPEGNISGTGMIAVPILGSADCGEATKIADQNLQGYLKISEKVLKQKKNVFALQATGNSMNQATIDGQSIEDGDFVIVESNYKSPNNGDYIVSIIDGVANIKRLFIDRLNKYYLLKSESTRRFNPIVMHETDTNLISGKVIQVIKN